MKKSALRPYVVLGVIFVPFAHGAETTFNGYASFVGGTAIDPIELPNGEKAVFVADPGYGGVPSSLNSNAAYTDKLSFSPDSNYGLQIGSNLGDGLKVTALLTGRGSTDYETEIEAMYLSYQIVPNTTLQFGRQRIPLFYYSDFFDVGYAYHWIRPPVEVYANTLINYDGASIINKGSLPFVSYKLKVYAGSAKNESSRFGNLVGESLAGLNAELSTDWLRIGATLLNGDFHTVGTSTDEDNSQSVWFGSLSANLTFGDFFALGEYTYAGSQEEGAALASPAGGGREVLVSDTDAMMFSTGYQIGSFTPHFSYSKSKNTVEINPNLPEQESGKSAVTFGIRWDFHSSSAFKVEYTSTTDESSDIIIQNSGNSLEAKIVSFGYDVIF